MEARRLPHPAQRGRRRRTGTGTGTGTPGPALGRRRPAAGRAGQCGAGQGRELPVAAGGCRWAAPVRSRARGSAGGSGSGGAGPTCPGSRWHRLPRGCSMLWGHTIMVSPRRAPPLPGAGPGPGAGPARPVPAGPVPAAGPAEPGTAAARCGAGGVASAPPPPITAGGRGLEGAAPRGRVESYRGWPRPLPERGRGLREPRP